MAGENYRRIVPSFWTDPDIKRGLALEDKMLLLYYFTSPHSNMIGLYYCPPAYVAAETGLAVGVIEDALSNRLVPFVTYDPNTEEVFVHAAARHQIGTELQGEDHRKKGVRRLLEGCHSPMLRRAFLLKYAAWNLGVTIPGDTQAPTKPLERASEAPTQAIAVAGAVAGTQQHLVAVATNGNGHTKPASKRRPSRDPPAGPPYWVNDAVEIYAKEIGFVTHGQAGRTLKPVVQRRGWDEVKLVLEHFCHCAPYEDYLQRMEANRLQPGEEKVKKLGYHTKLAAFVERYTYWATEAGVAQ